MEAASQLNDVFPHEIVGENAFLVFFFVGEKVPIIGGRSEMEIGENCL